MSRRQRLSFEPVEDQRLPHVGVSEAKRTRNSGVDMAPQESFTILPPLVPTIPPPPSAPTPFRLSQPANNRARKTSFVILSESAVQRSESEELRDEWQKAQNKPSRIPRSRPGSRDPSPLQRRLSDTVGSRIPQPQSPARHIKTAGDGGSPKRLAPRTNGVSKRQSLSPLQKRNVINRGRDRNVRGRPTAKERSPTVSRGTSPIREITGRLPEPESKPEPTEKTGKGRGRTNAAVKKPGKPAAKNGKPPLPSKNGASKAEESKPAASEPQVAQPAEEPKETETSKHEEQPAKKEEAPVPTQNAKAPTFKPDEVVYVTPTMASPQSTTATATISRAPNLSSTLSGLSAFRNTMATHSSSWKVSSALDKGPNVSASVAGSTTAETTKDGDPPSIITTPPTSGKAASRGLNLGSVASGVSAFKTGTPPSSAKHPRSPKLSSVAENRTNSPRSGRTVLSSATAGISAFRAPSPKAGRSSPHLSSAATGVSAFRTNSPKLSSNRLGNLSSATHGLTAFRNQLSAKQQQQQQQQKEGSAAAKQFSKNMVTCSVASSFKAAASGLPPVDSPSPVLEEPPAVESTATLVESTTEVAVATTALPDEKHTLSGISSAKAAFLAGRQTPTPQPESNGALTTTDTVLKEDPEIESLSANRLRSGKTRAMAFLRPRIDSPSGKAQEAGETKHGLCYRVLCVPWKRVGGLPCCQKCKKVCACCDRLNCDRCKCCKKTKGRATCCRKGNCCGKPTCCGKPSACGKGCLAKLNCFAKGRPKGRPSTHCCKKMDCCTNMKDCRASMKGACTKERCCPDGYKVGAKKCCKAFVCLPFACCKKGGCSCKRHKNRTSVGTMASKKTSSVDGAEPEVPKLDPTLVEHNSLMRAAIPVLPLPLAWICLFFNVFVPGLGTLCSGLLCLCFGKPRFSVRDDAQGRIGSFFVNLVIAVGQAFTVFFCLVGWGWSIWWGVIMLKLARKNKKLHKAEAEAAAAAATVAADQNHDVERAS